ncbi:glycosyltransferase 31 family protein [Pleurotus pulmonarius]
MSFSINMALSSPRLPSPRLEDYDSSSSNDSENHRPPHHHPRSRMFASTTATGSPRTEFLFPPMGRASASSTATTTPIPSRAGSPLPQYFSSLAPSSCTSDTESEPESPLLRSSSRVQWRDDRRWWTIGAAPLTRRRRRRRGRQWARTLRKWARAVLRHPLFPRQPITIILTLLLLSVLAISITLLIIYILNPDKEPLPWRAYCAAPSISTSPPDLASPPQSSYPVPSTSESTSQIFPPPDLDELPPAGLFIGVFSMDSAFERRMLVRTTWASHPRSRDGAGEGDGGASTSRTVVRFILGLPRKDWDRRIRLEMEAYNDIVILPVPENMNGGKTHTFFSWASINAWVPPVYNTSQSAPQFSYSNYSTSPLPLASHDPQAAWDDQSSGRYKSWVRPDYVVKVDDDSFVMLAELEARLRVQLHQSSQSSPLASPASPSDSIPPNGRSEDSTTLALRSPEATKSSIWYPRPTSPNDPLIYWGYLVKNRFMAGELYALSWSLVDWIAKDPTVKGMTKGAEDKQTAKWMALHPRANKIRWVSERCWIYDHPRSGTVYSHGFLFPSEATRVKRGITSYLDKTPQEVLSVNGAFAPTPPSWAHSSVSTFGVRYAPPIPDLTTPQSVEALVEGSDMSMIREGSPMTPEYAMIHREGRKKRYEDKRVGGTIVVHFIKKNLWFLETALALLDGDELSEAERYQKVELAREAKQARGETTDLLEVDKHIVRKAIQWHRRR